MEEDPCASGDETRGVLLLVDAMYFRLAGAERLHGVTRVWG